MTKLGSLVSDVLQLHSQGVTQQQRHAMLDALVRYALECETGYDAMQPLGKEGKPAHFDTNFVKSSTPVAKRIPTLARTSADDPSQLLLTKLWGCAGCSVASKVKSRKRARSQKAFTQVCNGRTSVHCPLIPAEWACNA
jgi:hypothetical protein